MPKNDIQKQLRDCVDNFVSEITALVRQSAVQAVEEALLTGGAPRAKTARKTKGRRTAQAKSGKRVRRSPEDIEKLAGSVVSHIQRNPGQRLEEIARAMGEPSKDLKRPIQTLMGAGQLRTEGQKRGTMYFAGKGRRKTAGKAKRKTSKKASRKTSGRKKAKRKAAPKRKTSKKKAA